MRSLLQSTAYNLMAFMTDAADHIAGKTGLTLTITASKNGAAFASITPTVTERGNGWYSLALTASHTDTVGDLAIRCTGTAADPTDLVVQVSAAAAVAPTAATVADAILARNLAGGSDGGRTVRDALRVSRNRTEIDAGTLTVYAEDDTTPAWTAAVTTEARDALKEINPA